MRLPAILLISVSCCFALPHAQMRGKRPQNPKNITVFGLRPYNLPDLNDKDTADAAGDVYFWLTDKILMPYTCREDPRFPLCKSSQIVKHDQVYEQSVLEVDSGSIGKYALCNPSTLDPTGHTWHCEPTEPNFGAGNVSQMYGDCKVKWHWRTYDQCTDERTGRPIQFMRWRVAAANILPGMWYSTQKIGNCDEPSSLKCMWRSAKTVKIANATCVNDRVVALVEQTGKQCFNACGPKKVTSDCYITCFMQTVLGNTTAGTPPKVAASRIMQIFNAAFTSDDPSKGGCPSLPPYVPPSQGAVRQRN